MSVSIENGGEKPKRKAMLSGYYGRGNFGDELMRLNLQRALPEWDLITLRDDIKCDDLDTGVEEKVQSTAFTIIGGGDLLVPSAIVKRYWDPRLLKNKVFIYGIGVPTQAENNPRAIEFYKKYFGHENVKFIAARDPQSAQWIKDNLELDKEIHHFHDLAWSYTHSTPLEVNKDAGNKILGIITRPMGTSKLDFSSLARMCEAAARKGYRIHNIVLGTGTIQATDLETASAFPYADSNIEVSSSIEGLVELIAKCSVIASMKFHGCLMAIYMDIPTIALLQHAKFKNLMANINKSEYSLRYNQPELAQEFEALTRSSWDVDTTPFKNNSKEGVERLLDTIHSEVG